MKLPENIRVVYVEINGVNYERSTLDDRTIILKSDVWARFSGFRIDCDTLRISPLVVDAAKHEYKILERAVGDDDVIVDLFLETKDISVNRKFVINPFMARLEEKYS